MSIHPLHIHNDQAPEEHFRVVVNDTPTFLAQRQAPAKIPDFEEKAVALSAAKITSVGSLDLEGAVFALDEILKVVVEVQVRGVDHVVDEATGRLTRMHRLKAVDATVVDWNLDLDSIRGRA